ncbi:trophoblast glycoprotein-like [Protopterus annectens]|uniref:trophoblast glycoprotein-like n=1 Tax=Protopterus annectens TaxID=7888 RepID=UPI001CFB7934|nr:trophoblast glycoprotein-like [Protopterus annectens]
MSSRPYSGSMVWKIIVLVTTFLPALLGSNSCPTACQCSEPARTVKCVLQDLEEVPSPIPTYTRNLFITGNHIYKIRANAFQGLDNLHNLSLANNRIVLLEPEAFASLPNLRFLDLSNNRLAKVHPNAFIAENNSIQELNLNRAFYNSSVIRDIAAVLHSGGFLQLSKLDMASNELIYLPLGIFSHLPALRHLDLKNNSIIDLKNSTFCGLDLEFLDLSANAFKNLRVDVLNELSRQKHLCIQLKDNPFFCNCEIEDFAEWLNSSEVVLNANKLVCAYPKDMQNVSLLMLSEMELGCHSSENTEIVLQTSYVLLGIVVGFVGIIFLFVMYLNRKEIKTWIYNMRDACRDLMEGYHYRYEIDSDPRVTQVSTSDV